MKKRFLTGLAMLLPLAVTIWVVRFLVNFLTMPFVGVVTELLHHSRLAWALPERAIHILSQVLILIGIFVFILLLGFVARRFFFHQMIQLGDRILKRIPLVNKVYKTSKEIVHSLFASDTSSFKQVVMIPFPYKGCYSLGIITNDVPEMGGMASIFVPTTPNPTTGFLIMLPRKDLIFLKMKSEEAIKYVVSCAVIQPKEAH